VVERCGGLGAGDAVDPLYGVVRALKQTVDSGGLASWREAEHGALLGGLLREAGALLGMGRNDAAAVLVGAVLVVHMRLLMAECGFDEQQCAGPWDVLHPALSGRAYGGRDVAKVGTWLGLWHRAAKGTYNACPGADVSAALVGVRSFVARFPA
jgi:hypothetical protein